MLIITAPHLEQQHRNLIWNMHLIWNSSTGTLISDNYHSGHFHRARWRIPPREYELESETCSHSS